ncbi:MAG TPA: hypothetical protein VHP83_21005 [Aggregatilineaceae bacterium]|nr:hypothetical protein [Aggregatilineaceae bacterium]
MLRIIFCAVPALRRVDPAIISGPTTAAIGYWASSSMGGGTVAGDSDGGGTRFVGGLERADHIGCSPAGRDPDDNILRIDLLFLDLGVTRIVIVFRAFD